MRLPGGLQFPTFSARQTRQPGGTPMDGAVAVWDNLAAMIAAQWFTNAIQVDCTVNVIVNKFKSGIVTGSGNLPIVISDDDEIRAGNPSFNQLLEGIVSVSHDERLKHEVSFPISASGTFDVEETDGFATPDVQWEFDGGFLHLALGTFFGGGGVPYIYEYDAGFWLMVNAALVLEYEQTSTPFGGGAPSVSFGNYTAFATQDFGDPDPAAVVVGQALFSYDGSGPLLQGWNFANKIVSEDPSTGRLYVNTANVEIVPSQLASLA